MTENSIKPSDRVAFVGKTGSGKTYLAKGLLSSVQRLIVLDAKGTLGDWVPNFDNDLEKKLMNGEMVRARIPAPIGGDWDDILWKCYEAGNVTIYIDEVYGISEGSKPSDALRAVITRGRELGIGVWSSTQRPSWIPLIILSECEWVFTFQLRLMEDKRRMASIIGPTAYYPLRSHNVIVYNDQWDDTMIYKQAIIDRMDNGEQPYHKGL